MRDLAQARHVMVEHQIARRGVRDDRVLRAMGEVPREVFLPAELIEFSYEDTPLPIDAGQTISQPYIVALMLEAAGLRPNDRVLEIGTGSGYAAAVLSRLCDEVFTIERHAELAEQARRRLRSLGCRNVEIRTADGTKGWPERAPFDAIIATAAGPSVPDHLRRQLGLGGRLIIPVGEQNDQQRLIKLVRLSASRFDTQELGDVRFVPLIGEQGWSEESLPRRSATPAKPAAESQSTVG